MKRCLTQFLILTCTLSLTWASLAADDQFPAGTAWVGKLVEAGPITPVRHDCKLKIIERTGDTFQGELIVFDLSVVIHRIEGTAPVTGDGELSFTYNAWAGMQSVRGLVKDSRVSLKSSEKTASGKDLGTYGNLGLDPQHPEAKRKAVGRVQGSHAS